MCCRGCGDFVTLLIISRNFSEISKFSIFVKKIPGNTYISVYISP